MKKVLVIIMMVVMILSAVGCMSNVDTEHDRVCRILTSYSAAESNGKTTIFRFHTYKDAREFQYYWLDEGYTVSEVIEHTEGDGYYTVEIMERSFNDVVRETRRAL